MLRKMLLKSLDHLLALGASQGMKQNKTCTPSLYPGSKRTQEHETLPPQDSTPPQPPTPTSR